jgi:mono/diheme cytochrome c family protein
VRRLATLLLVIVAGCSGGDRQGLTADSAVMQPLPPGPDSLGTPAGVGVDPGAGDTLALDTGTVANPTMVLIADSVAGDVLFRRKGKCLSCHGLSGKGIEALGPSLQDSVWLHGDGSFAFVQRMIVEGVARPKISSIGMPSFARPPGADASTLSNTLSPEEIYHISAYVYTLSHPGSAVADTTRPVVDTLAPPPDTLLPPVPPPAQLSADTVPSRADTLTGR